MHRYILRFLITNKKTRLILVLTLCVSLCITLIGLFSYSQYRKVLDTELNNPNVELLQINLDVTNRAFHEADVKAVDASFHPATLAYIRSETGNNAAKAADLQAYLKTLATQPDIQAMEVIKFSDRTLLSSQAGYIPSWEDPYPTWEDWTDWIMDVKRKPLLVKAQLHGTTMQPGQTDLLSLARPIVQDGQVTGAVMVHMDYDRLFSKIYTHLTSYQYVYNLEGELIYPKLNLPISLPEMDKVITTLDVRPFAYVEVEGQDYMANQAFSNVTGWRMISLVPMEQLLKNVKIARNSMLLLSLISILVGLLAMYYYNYAAFRPLKRINRLLGPGFRAGAGAGRTGDLHELEPVIDKLVGDFHRKAIVAEKSLPELRSKFIQDTITRNIGSQEIRVKWEQYFQDWETGPLAVMIVSTDRYWQWATAYQEEDQMLIKYALNNILLESLEGSYRAVSIADQKDGWAVLLQRKEPGEETLGEDASRLIETVAQYLDTSVSIGIGSEAEDILQVTRSYTEAKEALSHRLYEGYGTVQEYTTLELPHEDTVSVSSESWIKEIMNGLRNADSETSLQWIRRWSEETRKRETPPQRVYRDVDDLLEEILKFATLNNLSLPAELADYTWHQITTMKLEEIEEMLSRLMVQLSDQIGQRRQTKEYYLVHNMIRYMEEHLHENIGLQDIADHIHMGITSVSTIFKEETGTTVYDYLTNLRIEKACELLRETPLKIAEISLQVGYQNENSFIRAFRKNKSITPGKYREMNKSSNGYADPPKPRRSGVSEDSAEE